MIYTEKIFQKQNYEMKKKQKKVLNEKFQNLNDYKIKQKQILKMNYLKKLFIRVFAYLIKLK